MLIYVAGPTGKTAPRLLEDILDYDPRYVKKKELHLIADPAPQYTDPHRLIPIRKGKEIVDTTCY